MYRRHLTYLGFMIVDLFHGRSLRVLLEELDGLLNSLVEGLLVGSLKLVAVLAKLLLQTITVTLESVLGSGSLLDELI